MFFLALAAMKCLSRRAAGSENRMMNDILRSFVNAADKVFFCFLFGERQHYRNISLFGRKKQQKTWKHVGRVYMFEEMG